MKLALKGMKLFLPILALICYLLPAMSDAGPAAGEARPELWLRAVELQLAEQIHEMIPGRYRVLSESLDRRGQVKESGETWFALDDGDPARPRYEIVQAFKDGRDVTARAREERRKAAGERGRERSGSYRLGDSPLHPDRQSRVQVEESRATRLIDGLVCRRFDFSMSLEEAGETMVQGSAWIALESARPVRIELAPEPLPRLVKRFNAEMSFRTDENGRWVLAEFSIDGEGGLLVFRRRFRSTVTFYDYRFQAET